MPCFREPKALIDAGMVGQVVRMQHIGPIEHVLTSHSCVRGHSRKAEDTTPIILAGSCHDTDILRWLAGATASAVHCCGNLKRFAEANAPADHAGAEHV